VTNSPSQAKGWAFSQEKGRGSFNRDVQLNNNFEVKKGGNFTARIVECGEQ